MADPVPRIVNVGGVPEHFNLPWHLLRGSPGKHAFDIRWRDYDQGTGAMVAALNNDEIDIGILLSEGAVHGIAEGGNFRIVSFYVVSPLLWGIHVPADSSFRKIADLDSARFAISRPGSGSHLMSYLLAHQQGWSTAALNFVTVGNIDGAREAFADARADVFLWERFTTQPYVDSGEFRRVGDLPTPWPCFSVCVRTALLDSMATNLAELISDVLLQAAQLRASATAPELIAERYGLNVDAVRDWLSRTRWAPDLQLEQAVFENICDALETLGLISNRPSFRDLTWPLVPVAGR